MWIFLKLYQVTRGHSQGEIEAIFLMITSHGVYVMTRLEAGASAAANTPDSNSPNRNNRTRFKKDSFINHSNIEYIEVSLGEQAFHVVCIAKRQNIWITTGSKNLTRFAIITILNFDEKEKKFFSAFKFFLKPKGLNTHRLHLGCLRYLYIR